MIGANWKFTDDDGRQYHAVWDSGVNGPEWWLVTRVDDREHVKVPFTDAAGLEIEHREVERMALEKFRELGTRMGTRPSDPKTTEGDKP